jgi:adenylate kinase family enzyme
MIPLLSGAMNSGKSTVARALVDRCKRCAHVEVDRLREFVRWMPIDESVPLNLANAAAITRNSVLSGLCTVVSYPLSISDFTYLTEELNDLNVPIVAITLNPGRDQAVTNRGSRSLNPEEVARIHYMYESGLASPGFGIELIILC